MSLGQKNFRPVHRITKELFNRENVKSSHSHTTGYKRFCGNIEEQKVNKKMAKLLLFSLVNYSYYMSRLVGIDTPCR